MDGLVNDEVGQADDRGVLPHLPEFGLAQFVVRALREFNIAIEVPHDPRERVVDVDIDLIKRSDGRVEVLFDGDDGLDFESCRKPQFVDHEHIERVRHRHNELAFVAPDRQTPEPLRSLRRNLREDIRRRTNVGDLGEHETPDLAEALHAVALLNQPHIDEDPRDRVRAP